MSTGKRAAVRTSAAVRERMNTTVRWCKRPENAVLLVWAVGYSALIIAIRTDTQRKAKRMPMFGYVVMNG